VQWLTDTVDGRLIIDGRSISLAVPVRTRLTARFDHRARARPNTPKPHLLVNRRTAPRLVPVGRKFPWLHTTLRTQALREERILSESQSSGATSAASVTCSGSASRAPPAN
jgi:hypothetical protein